MADPFLSEIRLFSFVFAPKGWALCNGQLLPINQNQALFSLLGTTFGGDGRVNFGLPDLRGRVPVHVGNGMTLGQTGGEQAHTISISELPTHVHSQNALDTEAQLVVAAGNAPANVPELFYGEAVDPVFMAPQSVSSIGGSQAHQNMQPYLALNFSIALQGIFPSPT